VGAKHTPALDGVRGIAILLVLLHHFTIFTPITATDRALQFTALLGWSGVDLFFVLSGFLITGILIDARSSPRYFASFYMRRVLRIFPLYYLIVAICFLLLPHSPRSEALLVGATELPAWPYWTYLVNFAVADRGAFTHGVLDVAWSLAIEEQFYLLWPAVVFLCPPRLLGWWCGMIIVAAPLARSMALAGGGEAIDVYVLPHLRADALATGALLAWLMRRDLLPRSVGAGAVAAVIGLSIAVGCAIAAASPWWWEPPMQRIGYSAWALAGAGLVIVSVAPGSAGWWQRTLSWSWLRAFGKYSYAIYLLHLPMSRVVQEFAISRTEFPVLLGALWPAQLGFYMLATAPTFALAWLSWRLFEAPILRLKARFPYA